MPPAAPLQAARAPSEQPEMVQLAETTEKATGDLDVAPRRRQPGNQLQGSPGRSSEASTSPGTLAFFSLSDTTLRIMIPRCEHMGKRYEPLGDCEVVGA
ncbi:hypothetical protein V5799_032067 [Amblyomma americanum]|uniref:Uncharacterized protein n=1 Tax=Amblyomma americanum TaxID=6943 RepID=A0AAQ4DS84_AMBAM